MVPPGNDSKSNYRKLQIRGDHKHSVTFIIDRGISQNTNLLENTIERLVEAILRLAATCVRRKMASKTGNLGRKGGAGHFLIELRSKAIPILIDRLPMVQANVGREAKRPCKKKKKGREKRRGDGRKRGRSPSCRKIRSENERTSLPAAISRDRIGPDQIKN